MARRAYGDPYYYTRKALQYIIDSEKDDFLNQCEEQDITYEEGLAQLDNHAFYAALRGLNELEMVNG